MVAIADVHIIYNWTIGFWQRSAKLAIISGRPKDPGHRHGKKQFNGLTPQFSTTQFTVFSHVFYKYFLSCILCLERNQCLKKESLITKEGAVFPCTQACKSV